MKGKISKIKNMEDELVLPVTTVEAIYMEDGITKLSDEMKDVLKYEEFDNESVTTEIPSVKEEINGIKKDISEINSSLEESVKFEVVGEGSTVPPINGGGSYVYDDTEIRELINETTSEIARLEEIANTWETFKNSGGEINGGIQAHALKNIYTLTSGEKERCYYFGSLNNFDATIGMEILDKKSGFDTKVELAQGGNPTLGGQGYFGSSHDLVTNLGSDNKRWKDVWVGSYSKNDNGYTKLPNGLIMQWGILNMDINLSDSFSFDVILPMAFPTVTLYCSGNVKYNFTKDNDHYIEHINVNIQTLDSDRLRIKGRNVGGLDMASRFQVHWFAIGY